MIFYRQTRERRGGYSNDDGKMVAAITVSVCTFGLLALLLLLLKRRRTVMTQREIEASNAMAAAGLQDDDDSLDPPGSFHQGYYHYTKDGVRYLSPHCSTCRETERQLAFGSGLETIAEGEVYGEGGLVQANSRDIGGQHSGMNVHHCSSATCKLCCIDPRPEFVSAKKAGTLPDTGSANVGLEIEDQGQRQSLQKMEV